ncbi:Tify 4b [Thalictrum thalictroides]|uniref:Protein TIFY n=1 Tax=Thalictrum thalictroides TaxID=46969 RepID=A0A7J6VZ61_THATH|nr:Tify 4b [Thalictrum thalictroides]
MRPEETISRSPLDKPLFQLTDEDISQLTREDCRRFLREKGMRRPSWNKSQAIEQVICLKTLLEPITESDTNAAGFRQKSLVSRLENYTQVPSNEKRKAANVKISAPANETASINSGNPADIHGDVSCGAHVSVPDNNTIASRNMNPTNGLVGQMTIFYCGKVNVYDGMPTEKAHAIMQLAGSHINVPEDSSPAGTAVIQSFACKLQAASIRHGLAFPSAASPLLHNVVAETSQHCREEVTVSREVEPEGPMSRKASVQRYLEKRKDRVRFKNKRKIESSSSLEMFLNHQLGDQYLNEQSSQSRACSPSQPRPPHTPTRCSSVENQVKNVVFSIDLNNNDVQEA